MKIKVEYRAQVTFLTLYNTQKLCQDGQFFVISAMAVKEKIIKKRFLLKNFNHGKKSTKNLAKTQNKIKKKNEFCGLF